MMYRLPLIILRACQIVSSLIVLGLSAYATSVFQQYYQNCVNYESYYSSFGYGGYDCGVAEPPQLAFLLFASIFSLLWATTNLVGGIFWKPLNNPIVATVLDSLSKLFNLAAGIAVAIVIYASDIGAAIIAFAFITWALFFATTILNVLRIVKHDDSGSTPKREVDNQNPELAHV